MAPLLSTPSVLSTTHFLASIAVMTSSASVRFAAEAR
jgi:hypothetical protein